jgi:hypothetical protein
MMLDYFYGQSGELFAYYRIPKALFQDSRFRQLSTDARTLYGILLDRMSLSAKNSWVDEHGRVYIIYTVREVQESLCCAEHKAVKLFRELEQADLIERKRRGLGRPSLIYVKNFSSGLPKAQIQNCANSNSCAAESAVQVRPKSQSNKTDKNKTEKNHPFLPDETDRLTQREQLEDYFYQALEVELLLRLCPDDEDAIYQIVDLLVDTCSTKRKMLRIAGDDKPVEVVRSRLKKLNADHIVINSLRIAEVPMLPHMDRPADRKAGCKHRCTDAAMNYLKAEVMEMCHSEGLYQIDLLNGSKERITEREYWAQKKGQAALDRANAPIAADGIAPRQTKFETDKAKLRRTIREALAAASGFDEFAALLLRHGVTVKESRGRLSYLTPDRTKPITARKLGDDFDRAAVLSVLEQNAARAAEKPAAIAEYPGSIKDRLRTKKEAKNAPNNDAVQRMVDIAAKRAEGKGRGYEKWATMHNLKQMSATLMLYQQYGFSSPDELDAAISAANTATQESLAGLKGLEAAIREKKELQRNLLGYIGTKPARDGLKAQKSEKARRAYREQHESDFIIADTAARYFREHGITKLPASKALQREIEQLTVQKNAGYNDYREKRQRAQELQTVRRNIDQILRGAPSQQKKREQER